MIVAKTNLKKIPEACNKCKFSKLLSKLYQQRCCTLLNDKLCEKTKSKSGNDAYIRLKNCPLINLDNIS